MFKSLICVHITSNCTFTDVEHDLFKDNVPTTGKQLTQVHSSSNALISYLVLLWFKLNATSR